MAMNKTLVSTIVCFTIVLLMAVFQFALDDAVPIAIPESLQGHALYVCPAESETWDALAAGFGHFYRYLLMGFFFSLIVLLFVWGWYLYQNLLQDKFKRDDFKNPWGFTKLLFWATVIMIIVLHTPNSYRHFKIRDTAGEWVACESTSEGAKVVPINLIETK
ncbi:MAG: hypothetical protein J5613_01470 [Alphaproteobacteria bacterium]|nr:hypothetical protein [Alphaproteobacteria bacterium]